MDGMECVAIQITTAARLIQNGDRRAPAGWHLAEVERADGVMWPMAVQSLLSACDLVRNLNPKELRVRVAEHEDAERVMAVIESEHVGTKTVH